jgi:hypothetical protein
MDARSLISLILISTSPPLRDLEIRPLVTSASILIARDRLPLDLLARPSVLRNGLAAGPVEQAAPMPK